MQKEREEALKKSREMMVQANAGVVQIGINDQVQQKDEVGEEVIGGVTRS